MVFGGSYAQYIIVNGVHSGVEKVREEVHDV